MAGTKPLSPEPFSAPPLAHRHATAAAAAFGALPAPRSVGCNQNRGARGARIDFLSLRERATSMIVFGQLSAPLILPLVLQGGPGGAVKARRRIAEAVRASLKCSASRQRVELTPCVPGRALQAASAGLARRSSGATLSQRQPCAVAEKACGPGRRPTWATLLRMSFWAALRCRHFSRGPPGDCPRRLSHPKQSYPGSVAVRVLS